jgi:hypothetical protein
VPQGTQRAAHPVRAHHRRPEDRLVQAALDLRNYVPTQPLLDNTAVRGERAGSTTN